MEAAATVLAQAASAVWVFGYFLSGKSLLRLRVEQISALRWSMPRVSRWVPAASAMR